jgi:polar amino acid transport system substrate-binding protein
MFSWNSSKLEEEIDEKNDQIRSLQLSIKELNAEAKEHEKIQARELRTTKRKLQYTTDELEKARKELESLNMKLQEVVSSDSLTDTYNKRYFYDIVEPIISLIKREKQHLSLVSISIDRLKTVLQHHGEDGMNRVIQHVVQSMSHTIRESDVFVKFDEKVFIILLPNTSFEQAHIMSEKLRASIEALNNLNEVELTISLGIAEYLLKSDNINTVIERSTKALLRAKEQGGNQVCS